MSGFTKLTGGVPVPTNDALALSPADAAKTLGIGRTNLYKLIAAGLIDARRLGGRTIIPATSLRDFLAGLPAAPIRGVSGANGGSISALIAKARGETP